MRSEWRWALALSAMFLFIAGPAAFRHEMWRDELQAWLVARDSHSLTELLGNLRYEGHPAAWYLLLAPLTRLFRSPAIMQLLHVLIATATILLLTRFAPFTRLQKVLLVLGYFFVFEYSVIARNYALGILLFFVACRLYAERKQRLTLLTAVLVLLAHTSVHALILTIAFSGILFLELLSADSRGSSSPPHRRLAAACCVIVSAIVASVFQLIPPSDTGYAVEWITGFDGKRIRDVAGIIPHVLLPIPEIDDDFWWSWMFESTMTWPLTGVLSLLFVGWISLALLRRPAALLLFVTGTAGLLSFFYVKLLGDMNHHGFLFVLLLGALWIARNVRETPPWRGLAALNERAVRTMPALLSVLLVVQAAGGLVAIILGHRYVFSYGKRAATFIAEHRLDDLPIIADRDAQATSVIGYLDGRKVFFVRGMRAGSFVKWDSSRLGDMPDREVIERSRQLIPAGELLLVMNRSLATEVAESSNVEAVATFAGNAVTDEEFYLYRMSGPKS